MLNTATLKTRKIEEIKQFDKNLLKHFETVQLFIDFNFYFKLSNVVIFVVLQKNKCTLQVSFHNCSDKQTRFLYIQSSNFIYYFSLLFYTGHSVVLIYQIL